jgi:acetolactate synthase-1/2/3 large subunit
MQGLLTMTIDGRTETAAPLSCGEALVGLLEDYGVELVFGIPGVHTIDLYRGLAHSSIRHITPRHEQGAGFMADGYARVSGKPGVCFIITGPGMTNIATAMAQAYADSIPMLVISSVNPARELGLGNGRLHELPSQRNLVSGFSAFSHTLQHVDQLPQVLARAFSVFHSARPRPVHIEIPLDIIRAPAPAWFQAASIALPARPQAGADAIARAAGMLSEAQRPLILAGGGAIDAASALQSVAEKLQAPVCLTINAKGLLPAGHPLLVGSTQSLPATRQLIAEADRVLAVGTELGETDYDVVFDGGLTINGQLIRIDIDAAQLHANFAPALAMVSDAKAALQALEQQLPVASTSQADWGAVRVAQVRAQEAACHSLPLKVHRQLLDSVCRTLPGVILVGDSTQPVYSGNLVHDAARPRCWFNSSTGYGTLGYALPAAIGACLATTSAPVVCLIGDGGLQFTLPELASAIEARTPLIVLLWNNQGYGEIKRFMQERDIALIGVDIYTPDFLQIATGFGCAATRANTPQALEYALQQALTRDVPTVIELNEDQWLALAAEGMAQG